MPPVASPSAPSTSAPAAAPESTTPVSAPSEAPINLGDEVESELESMSNEDEARVEGRTTEKAPAKPGSKPAEKPPEKPKPDLEEAPKEDKPPEKPVEELDPEDRPDPKKVSELRTAYDEVKKRAKLLKSQKAELEEKLKAAPTAKPQETTALVEKLTSAEKRRDELESEMRFINYTKSTEFQEKYSKPYTEAWNKAISELSELTVEKEGEQPRQANANDLLKLCNLPLGEARKLANELFGDSADDVMAQRREIRRLSDAQSKALEDAKTQGKDWEQNQIVNRNKQQEQSIKLWQAKTTELGKRKLYSPVEGDAEGNELLQQGMAEVDRHFTPTQATAPKTTEEAVALHAAIRFKAGNHDRVALYLKRANARVKELESELAQFRTSEPPAGKGGDGKAASNKSWQQEAEEEIEALNRA